MEVVSNHEPLNVLFLCTGNSARSIMAEAILNRLGRGKFKAFSAGSQPAGYVHPLAIQMLRNAHFDVSNARSKPWDEFTRPDAPNRFCVYRLRQPSEGSLPRLAGSAYDRPLGTARSSEGRG